MFDIDQLVSKSELGCVVLPGLPCLVDGSEDGFYDPDYLSSSIIELVHLVLRCFCFLVLYFEDRLFFEELVFGFLECLEKIVAGYRKHL